MRNPVGVGQNGVSWSESWAQSRPSKVTFGSALNPDRAVIDRSRRSPDRKLEPNQEPASTHHHAQNCQTNLVPAPPTVQPPAMSVWPFDQPPATAAITTQQVLEGHPVNLVVHYADDHSWAFQCGTSNEDKDGRVISMEEAVALDPSIVEVASLPPGWIAWREQPGAAWVREKDRG